MTSTTTSTTKMQQLTREEVRQSNGKGKTILLLHDKVYDVSQFLNEHPGGEEVLLDHGGKDASEDFDDVGHSQDAHELMKKYLIGELTEHERSNKVPKKGWVANYGKQGDKAHSKEPGFMMYMLLGGLATALLAAYVYLL